MVFQKANPFPMSIYDNIAYGPARTACAIARSSTRSWSARCARRHLGRGEGPAQKKARSAFPADSSRGSASPARLPSSRRCCSWTSPRARSTPSRRSKIEDLACELKEPLHRRHGDAQYAAGGAHFGQHRLLPARRAGGVRQDGAGLFSTPADKRTEDYITGRFG